MSEAMSPSLEAEVPKQPTLAGDLFKEIWRDALSYRQSNLQDSNKKEYREGLHETLGKVSKIAEIIDESYREPVTFDVALSRYRQVCELSLDPEMSDVMNDISIELADTLDTSEEKGFKKAALLLFGSGNRGVKFIRQFAAAEHDPLHGKKPDIDMIMTYDSTSIVTQEDFAKLQEKITLV